ncbi:MAG: hypothetical protein LUQ19_05400 [Methanoregula sp.]|nr:hypothetical protein [Methanoregula sp.]
MTGFGTRIIPALRNGRITIPLTAGLCLILLAVVLKNVLYVPADRLSSEMLLYIIIYTGFLVTFPLTDTTDNGPASRTILWTGIIILITLGIIAVYAI